MIDARDLFPLPDNCDLYYLYYVKDLLVQKFGIDEGFRIFREQLSPAKSINRAQPKQIQTEYVKRIRDAAATENSFVEIYPSGETFEIPPPRLIGDGEARPLAGTARSFYVACLPDASVRGRSPFIRVGGQPAFDYELRELQTIDDRWSVDHYVFASDGDVISSIQFDLPTLDVEEAFGSLLGISTMAWGHWLGDFIPKYVAAILSGHIPKVPVLIDARMPQTHRRLLELVMPEGTQVIEVSPEVELRVRKLWYAPSLIYAMLLPKFNEKFVPDKFCSVPARYTPVLNELGRAIDLLPHTVPPIERLYLARRPSRWTKLLNSDAIESLLTSRGFTVLYPEDYPIHEVAQYVRAAAYVVGPYGSQMFNTFFARSGARICYLAHPYLLGGWPYFLREIGVDVTMLTGPAVNVNDSPEPPHFGYPHHADYEIDPEKLAAFLVEWLVP